MKKLITLFAVILSITLVAPHVEAKRFGGGKSFGKSFKTAPAPKKQIQNTNTIQKQPTKATNANGKKGFMGGLFGGLLAGGMLAALFGSGAFDGIQFMDILLIGILIFVLFKLVKFLKGNKQTSKGYQQAYAGNSSAQHNNQFKRQSNQAQYGQAYNISSDVPYNLPQGFDASAFLDKAKEHYRVIQDAWNKNNMGKIKEYVAPALFDHLVQERNLTAGAQNTQVIFVNAQIVRADYNRQTAQLSIQFSGKIKDDINEPEDNITDIWHLERDLTKPNAPWLIIGIQA